MDSIANITIAQLAYACSVYATQDFDRSYAEFLTTTRGEPDLCIAEHRAALLKWLNAWGCRQFAIEYHERASGLICHWFQKRVPLLFPTHTELLDLDTSVQDSLAEMFDALSRQIASYKRLTTSRVGVRFGSTGAAKILFALRPRSLPPWDESVRKYFHFGNTGAEYVRYVTHVRSMLQTLAIACRKHGFEIGTLPQRINRPSSTLPKLVDEYFWVTITRGCPLPDHATFCAWATWSGRRV